MSMVLKTVCLTKKYGHQRAVDKVSLNIEKGDIYGLIGKNGAGKTTIMKMVSGLIHSNEGSVELFESSDLEKGRKRIGCVIEQPALYPGMTARENLLYYSKLLGCVDSNNVNESLDLVGLKDTGKKKTKHFSLGMKQRLSIAVSLLGSPDFLILDEPINGLDPSGIKEIRELMLKLNEENNITILISSHILGELSKIATKYGIIDSGVLVDEFTSKELDERCKKCLSLVVDDTKKASYVLTSTIKSKDFQVYDHGKICVYDCMDNPAQINRCMVESGISVSTVCYEGNDTEAYFVKMMGGSR